VAQQDQGAAEQDEQRAGGGSGADDGVTPLEAGGDGGRECERCCDRRPSAFSAASCGRCRKVDDGGRWMVNGGHPPV
jgi:hypothetical protein